MKQNKENLLILNFLFSKICLEMGVPVAISKKQAAGSSYHFGRREILFKETEQVIENT